MKKHNWNPELYWHESEGNTKTELKKISFFFFSIFKKLGRGVGKTKMKKNSGLMILSFWTHIKKGTFICQIYMVNIVETLEIT